MDENIKWHYSKYKKIALTLLEQCKSRNLNVCESQYVLDIAKSLIIQAQHHVALDTLYLHLQNQKDSQELENNFQPKKRYQLADCLNCCQVNFGNQILQTLKRYPALLFQYQNFYHLFSFNYLL